MSLNILELSDSEISGATKIVYAGWREKLFPILTVLLAQLEKAGPGGLRNYRWGGKGINFDTVLTRPVGMSASATGFFPPHHVAIERQGTIDIKRLYVSRQIDGLAINGSSSKEMAYISLARKILEEAKDAARLGMQEIVHGDGRAVKAVVTTNTSNTTFTVQHPYGITGAGQGGLWLDTGMFIAVLNAAGALLKGTARIVSVTHTGDAAVVVIDTAAAANGGVQNTDILVAATTQDNSFNGYPNGLTNMLNRGGSYNSIHGIDAAVAGQGRWNSTQLVAGTDVPDNPTELDVWELIRRVAGVSGQDAMLNPREFLLLTTPGIEKKIAESYLGQRRFAAENMMKLKGGWSAIQCFGIPLVADPTCPAGVIYLIHLPSMSWVDAKDWGQVQYEGAGAWRWVDGRDAFQINWGAYINLAVIQRNAHGMIRGYTDTGRYTFVQS
jgi:hypothetical protein